METNEPRVKAGVSSDDFVCEIHPARSKDAVHTNAKNCMKPDPLSDYPLGKTDATNNALEK